MNADNIIRGMESFIKKVEDNEEQLIKTISEIREKYSKEYDEFREGLREEKPIISSEFDTIQSDWLFTFPLKRLLKEIKETEK